MTKLTTERLETIATWREKYGNGANVMIPSEEAELMARRILAYEQAAKNPIGSFHISGGQVEATTDYCRDGEWPVQDGEALVYAAPVLPEQPEPTISFYRDGIIAAAKWVENQRDAYDNEHGQSDPDTGAFEFGNDAQLEYSTTLSEIAEGIRSLHPTSAQPVSEPYKLKDAVEDIRNSGVEIDADKIKAERDTLNSPVIPDGWVMVPQQIFLDASDIESICSQCGDGHKSGYGDFTDGLLWVGDIQCDNGTIMHGLHISSSDYQEEGGLTLAEFAAPAQESE